MKKDLAKLRVDAVAQWVIIAMMLVYIGVTEYLRARDSNMVQLVNGELQKQQYIGKLCFGLIGKNEATIASDVVIGLRYDGTVCWKRYGDPK